MAAQPYDSEPVLQKLLAEYPHLLAGGQIDEERPRRWLLIGQEMGIPWEEGGGNQLSLDHLFLDQDGIPTLVEVKRSSDTRIRREVVGQMLEYAANAVTYWPVETLRARFEAKYETGDHDAIAALTEFLGDVGDEGPDVDEFWQQVRTNLQAGRIRMLFVADEIPFQLRRIVEFLNAQMSEAEVLAVEVKQYVGQGLQTLVPRVMGQTAHAQQTKTAGKRETKQWNEELFFEALSQRATPVEVDVARRILEWGKERTSEIQWGSGKKDGSFIPILIHGSTRHQVICVWTFARLNLQFEYLMRRGSLNEGQRLELLHRINSTLDTHMPDTDIERLPGISLSLLAKPGVQDAFLADLNWTLDQIAAQ